MKQEGLPENNSGYSLSLDTYLGREFFDKSPLHWLLSQIAVAQNFGAFYPALVTALMIPDFCSNFKEKGTTSKRYTDWVRKYLRPYFEIDDSSFFDRFPDEIYYLRCRLSHQGVVIPDKKKDDKANNKTYLASILFSHSQRSIHDLLYQVDPEIFPEFFEGESTIDFTKPFYIISIHLFAKIMIFAALDWIEEVKDDPEYENYLSQLYCWRTGLSFLGTGSQWFLF